MKLRFFSLVGAGALVASLLVSAPAAANGEPTPDAIVSCDVDGADRRGSEVCFVTASLTRSGSPLTIGTQFGLFYQDESAAFGEGAPGFVVRVGVQENGGLNAFASPSEGDVAELTIAYPVVNRAAAGDVEGLRGTDVAAGVFAVTSAADFSYSKSIETLASRSWVEFDISKTFVESWSRTACTFGDFDDPDAFDEETGYAIPPAACGVENGTDLGNGAGAITSTGGVQNSISFFTPETFTGFVNETSDGGYLNYQGSGIVWFEENNSFKFQIIGPAFASGSTRNSGALQAFLPQGYMVEIFGPDFSPSSPVMESKRFDASQEAVTEQDLSNQVVASARNGGLLLELASYPFSAPVFSFGAVIPASTADAGVPGIFMTVAGHIGRDAHGSPVYYGADRVARASSYMLTLSPAGRGVSRTQLAEGTIAPDGSFSEVVRLPPLSDGMHEIQFSGRHRNGATLELTAIVVVLEGKIASVGPNVPIIR